MTRAARGLPLLLLLALIPAASRSHEPVRSPYAPVEVVLSGLHDLVGVAVAPDGTAYVSDRGAGDVYVVSPAGRPVVLLSRLHKPAGLALAANGLLLIAEGHTGRVLRREASGALTVLAKGIKSPLWLAPAPDGSVYVSAHKLAPSAREGREDEGEEDYHGDHVDHDKDQQILHLVPGQSLTVVATGLRQLQSLVLTPGSLIAATSGLVGARDVGTLFRFPVQPGGSLGAPTPWVDTGLNQPVGLAVDELSAVYVSAKTLTSDTDTSDTDDPSKRTIGKVHQDGTLTAFASRLRDPEGLAFGPDGSLYVADGTAGRLLRFAAPHPPTLAAVPEFTNRSPLTVTGTTQAGARIDLFVNEASPPVEGLADSAGAFALSVPLALNAQNTLDVFDTASGGNGLTSATTQVTAIHDNIPPSLAFQAPPANAYVRQVVTVQARATDAGSGVASVTLTAAGGGRSPALTPPPPSGVVTAVASWDTRAVSDGAQTLAAAASDRAGNSATVTRVVLVDNTPPHTQITSGPSGIISAPTAPFTFTGTDNLTPQASLVFAWRLDAAVFTPFTSATTATFTNLAAGTHTFEVKARDLAGNEDPTPASRMFTVVFGPTIARVDPASGPVGTVVTIAGMNFAPAATQVAFSGVTAFLHSATATTITTTVPPGATTGPLTVTTSLGTDRRPFAVTTTGDFTLTGRPAPPETVGLIAGDQGSASVQVGGTGAFTGLVTLSLSSTPTGITPTLASQFVAPGGSAFVTFTVANTVPPGNYTVTITGQAQVDAQTLTRSASLILQVLPANTTAVTGRVLTAEAVPQPIPGATITLGAAFTLTDAGGNFVLLAPPAGANMLLVDGRTASTPTVQYPPVEVNIAVNASGPTRVPFIVYLPKLDTGHPVTLPLDANGFTTQTVQATTPTMPGLVVTIPSGTKIPGPDGNPVQQITITPVPVDRSPMPFPQGLSFPSLFTIQPGGAVPSQPLPITFPGTARDAPGSSATLYFFDLSVGAWNTWGTGTVSPDGSQVVSNPGYGLPRFAWHSFCGQSCTLPPGTPPGNSQPTPTAGEPVDLATGSFRVDKTDLVLPARIPLQIQRTYYSSLATAGFFGLNWNLAPYDTRLASVGTSLVLIRPDQSRVLFTPAGATWTTATAPALAGAVITQLPGEFSFQLRFKDGTLYHFDRIVGFANVAGLTAITDRNGNTVTITRQSPAAGLFGLITQITEPAGRALTLTYDTAGRITTVTDPIGRTVQYAYDSQGRLTTVTDPAAGTTSYAYDAANRILSITDPRGITFLTNQFDQNGRVTRQTQADGGGWAFSYELLGPSVAATTVTDPRGHPTTSRFDSQGFTLSVTDALGQTSVNTYAAGSNLLLSTTDPLGRLTQYTYDGNANVTSITDPAGNGQTFTYEPTFDRITSVTDPRGQVTQFGYDGHGNLTAVTDPLGQVTRLAYDALGQLTSATDPLGNATTFAYDSVGDLATSTDPLGNTTTRQYDAVSRLTSQADPLGRVTRSTYDALNRLVTLTDAVGGVTAFSYDGNGNLLAVTDARGQTTTYTYDAIDRVASRTDPVGATETFAYDGLGNLGQHVDRKGQISRFTYDPLNRRVGAAYADATVGYRYDPVGRLVGATDSAGGTLLNQYDVLDRLVAQTTALGTVSYQYDPLGRRTGLAAPAMPAMSYGYDAASRVTAISQGSQLVQLHYDAAGRRTQLTLPNGVTVQSQYDAASRLTALLSATAAGPLGNLTYGYDATGNRTAVGGSLAGTVLPAPVPTATYDAANRQLTFGATQMAFDANGNLTSLTDASSGSALTWDARDRLVAMTGPSVTAGFAYDSVGRRAQKTVNGTTTGFLYDGLMPVQEFTAGGATTLLTGLGLDEVFTRTDPTGTATFLSDVLGSTVALTDAAGTFRTQYRYEPFGTTTAAGATSPNEFQYTGREHDGPTGLYFYRARYYLPALARFLSPDPLLCGETNVLPLRSIRRNPQLLNGFVFVANAPLNLRDPLGLSPECDYYRTRCVEVISRVSKAYYCEAALTVCEKTGRGPIASCYRQCLQDFDRDVCIATFGRKDPYGLTAACTEVAGHAACLFGCVIDVGPPGPPP